MFAGSPAVRALAMAAMLGPIGSLAASEDFNAAAVGSYQEPGFNSNRQFADGEQVDSIDPFSGALKIVTRDLLIPGNGGLDIEVLRNYQSVTNTVGPYSNGHIERTPFGTGWDLHFGRLWVADTYNRLVQADNNRGCQIGQVASNLNPILELPDGSRHVLANGDGSDHAFISKARWIGRCLPIKQNKGDGGLLVFSPDGRKYVFDLLGTVSPDKQLRSYFVTRIEDADGNALDFSYNVSKSNRLARHHLLKRITATDGRVVDFSYHDENGPRAVLTGVSANGVSIGYGYADANWKIGAKPHYLASVNYPDGTRWTYAYNNANSLVGAVPGRFSMTGMTSPLGLRVGYEYGFQQMGVDPAEKLNVVQRRTLSNILGVQPRDLVWEYQYIKGFAPRNDQTLERGPLQCITYEHIGTNTIANGASGVDQGLWKVGSLVRKVVAGRAGAGCGPISREETYTWDRQEIAPQKEMRRYNLLVENRTRAPVLVQRSITQDGATYLTRYTHDAYGQPLTVAEQGQGSRTTHFRYTRPGGRWMLGKVSQQSISGIPGEIANSYTGSGRLAQKSVFGVVTRYAYSANGDLTSETDANGQVTSHADYFRGIPRLTRQADGGLIRRTVNPAGTLASLTDPLGRVTSYAYDAMNRVTRIQLPKSSYTRYDISYAFGPTGVMQTAVRAGYALSRQYNSLGQFIAQIESGGASTIESAAIYRADGQKLTLSLPGYGGPSPHAQHYEYDGLGRLTRVRHADGSVATTAYGTGNVQTQWDENGNATTSHYLAYGDPDQRQRVRIEQPGGVVTHIGRDPLGRVTVLEQGGLRRTYAYDSRGFLASEFNPETLTTQYGYDAVGNRTSRKVGAAAMDHFIYDAMNRQVSSSYGGVQTFTRSYDPGGRLVRQTSYQGTVWDFTYNAHDQIIRETLTEPGAARALTMGYGYNSRDQLHTITYPSGLEVFYNPDVYGRPTQVGAFAHSVSFHANGALRSLIYANGRTLSIGQDSRRLRPTDRRIGGLPQFNVPMALRYGYDAAGNLTQLVDEVDGRHNQSMRYDGLNRLVSTNGAWGEASYGYNGRGDLTFQQIGGRRLDYAYDGQGRLAALNGSLNIGFTYNNRGNVTQGRSRYTYNGASQMLLYCASPQWDCSFPSETYRYDPRGYRSATAFANGTQVFSLYGQEGRLLREDFPADGGFVEHVYLAGERIASRMQCEFVDDNANGVSNCKEKRFPVNGHQGTVF